MSLANFLMIIYRFFFLFCVAVPAFATSAEEYEIPASISQLPDSGLSVVKNYKKTEYRFNVMEYQGNNSQESLLLAPNQIAEYKAFAGEVEIFDAVASINEHSRRWTPHSSKRFKHFLMIGRSFVFGLGVKDDETMPAIMSHAQSQYNVYNMGFPSYGANELLWLARNKKIFSGVKESEGIALFLFMPQMFYRAINGMDVVGYKWGARLNRYVEIASDGSVQDQGLFINKYPLITWIYSVLVHSSFLRLIGLQFPIFHDAHYEKNVQVLKSLKDEYIKQFGENNKFVVALYPRGGYRFDIQKFKSKLKREHIHFIDYSVVDLQEKMKEPSRLKYDPHPSKEANKVFVQLLLTDLSRQGISQAQKL